MRVFMVRWFSIQVFILPPTPSEGGGDWTQRVLWNIVFWFTFGLLKFLKVGMSRFLLRSCVMPTKEVSHYIFTVMLFSLQVFYPHPDPLHPPSDETRRRGSHTAEGYMEHCLLGYFWFTKVFKSRYEQFLASEVCHADEGGIALYVHGQFFVLC